MHSTEHRSSNRLGPALLIAAGLVSAASLLFNPAAHAQKQAQPQPQPQTESQPPQEKSQTPNFSSKKLDAAAAAIGHVNTVKQSYQQQLAKAPESDKPRIAGEANNAMAKAVTDQGISVDEFNSIIEAAQNDPALRQQLVQRIRGHK
ncbi:MAG: DUF4168 domain-containing protein [Alphaproteobacteria bacterium]|nr:DUF4168 domain-containing protein [Alphaproteobacteria bacterium]